MTAQPLAANPLSQAINRYVEELAALTDQARLSSAMQAYLDTCARFHRYSWHNTLLILLARPDACQVAGYKTWTHVKRQVKKGEKGIPILAPVVIRPQEGAAEREVIVRFKVVYVFDISQTEGEPLPPPPEWRSPERHDELTVRLLTFAASQGITVSIETLPGAMQGASKGGRVVLSPTAGTKILIHELAHELLHQDRDTRPASRQSREAEAEAVAYVVGRHFGLDDLSSPNYLALWHADSDVIRAHLERISLCSRQIISALETEASPAEEVMA
jgi:hypothetical protein